MKRFFLTVIFSTIAIPAFASEFTPGAFSLYGKPNHKPNMRCDVGSELRLDEGKVIGKIALMQDFVSGICELYVAPNPRYYEIASVEDDGCGSRIYSGSRRDDDGTHDVEIVDNRGRLCDDIIPALIVVKEKGPNSNTEKTLYSYDERR